MYPPRARPYMGRTFNHTNQTVLQQFACIASQFAQTVGKKDSARTVGTQPHDKTVPSGLSKTSLGPKEPTQGGKKLKLRWGNLLREENKPPMKEK